MLYLASIIFVGLVMGELPINTGRYFQLQNDRDHACIYTRTNQFSYYTCIANDIPQHWSIESVGDFGSDSFRIKSRETGRCIVNREPEQYVSSPNWYFETVSCSQTYRDQYWEMSNKQTDGSFQLRNRETLRCMFQNNDGRFGISSCNTQYTDQFWKVIDRGQISDAHPVISPDDNNHQTPHDQTPHLVEPKWKEPLFDIRFISKHDYEYIVIIGMTIIILSVVSNLIYMITGCCMMRRSYSDYKHQKVKTWETDEENHCLNV